MRITLLPIAVALGLAVGIPAATYIANTCADVQAAFDTGKRYQLTIEVDGDYYIADSNLTRADCMGMVSKAADWTDGHARYSCDVEPLQGAK